MTIGFLHPEWTALNLNQKSTSEYVCFVEKEDVVWKSKTSSIVGTTTAEKKYIALKSAALKFIHLKEDWSLQQAFKMI